MVREGGKNFKFRKSRCLEVQAQKYQPNRNAWFARCQSPCHGSGNFCGLSLRTPGLIPKLEHVGFVADKVVLGQIFLRILQFSAVTVMPLLLHTQAYVYHRYYTEWRISPLTLNKLRLESSSFCSTLLILAMYTFGN
jgi:hypothetical protein